MLSSVYDGHTVEFLFWKQYDIDNRIIVSFNTVIEIFQI